MSTNGHYDVIIIGTGAGGGTLAHKLAPTGKKILIHALRGIEAGEELAYDYQYERTGENDAELEKFYVCKCGADSCRGSIMKPASKKRRRKRRPANR